MKHYFYIAKFYYPNDNRHIMNTMTIKDEETLTEMVVKEYPNKQLKTLFKLKLDSRKEFGYDEKEKGKYE